MMINAIILSTNIIFLFHSIQSNVIAEFDLSTTEENRFVKNVIHFAKDFGDKIETKLGHSYELLGQKISEIGSQLDENKNNLADQIIDFYTGPLANQSSNIYENLQYNSGKFGDGLSSILHWLGENMIKIGHNAGLVFSSSFHTIGDLIGTTIDTTEHLIGTNLIKSSEQIHSTAIELEHNSHENSENFRNNILKTAPRFHRTLIHIFRKLGEKFHNFGIDTQTAGKVLEDHHLLDTFKQAYPH